MKKFTILLATIATLFSASLFTACSEEESNDLSIVGTWEFSEKYEDGGTGTYTLTFKNDGSGSIYFSYKWEGGSETESCDFEYVYNESTHALTLIGSSNIEDIFGDRTEAFVTANKLRLVMYYDYYEESQSITFTRK